LQKASFENCPVDDKTHQEVYFVFVVAFEKNQLKNQSIGAKLLYEYRLGSFALKISTKQI
jgi:hypothetical protein